MSGSFSSIPRGTAINLTAAGPIDWVHWGLYTPTSVDRKANVTPMIGPFTAIATTNATNAAVSVYQFSDNYNGYSWSDGTPTATITNTTTGVWAYGFPNSLDSGFEFEAPADTSVKTLKVYVGAFEAVGLFQASLSDGSAAAYADSSLTNKSNGDSAVYTLQYAAASAGQTIKVRWTVKALVGHPPTAGNVTLQAAALTAAGANNPPSVELTSPTENATFAAGANITVTANAIDLDGTVVKVEFFDGSTKLGEDTTSPYSFAWNNVPAGYHVLSAVASDNTANFALSMPVEMFVNGPGGALSGTVATPTDQVDLTLEGTNDWSHWGLSTNSMFDHKKSVTPRIGDFTVMGDNSVQQYGDNLTGFFWSDGTPTLTASNSTTGVFIMGLTNGFQLQIPADTTTKRLKVYVGAYGAQGNFQAYLSDFSAKAYTDMSISNVYDSGYAVYTLNYAAASTGQSLIIQYRSATLFDFDFGNVTLQAATLVETNSGTITSNTAPAITQQPSSLVVTQGNSAQFTVAAHGTPTPTYQWRFGGNPISGATATNYPIASAQGTNAGDYDVVISNTAGSVTSSVATLTVRIPPSITTQPQSQTVPIGSNVTFTVSVTGTAPLSYQWQFNGANLIGANSSGYQITFAQPSNAGPYTVVITNVAGSITSAPAVLTVVGPLQLQVQLISTNGSFGIKVFPTEAQPYSLDVATNLTNWTSIFTNQSGAANSNYIQAPITNTPHRFFRGKLWP